MNSPTIAGPLHCAFHAWMSSSVPLPLMRHVCPSLGFAERIPTARIRIHLATAMRYPALALRLDLVGDSRPTPGPGALSP